MDRELWLEYRKSGIGGSETASVLGLNPYQTRRDLALYKLGMKPEQPDNPAMQRGRYLEPIVAELFSEQTGLKLQDAQLTIRHPEHPHMLASFDRLAENGETVVEIKCPGLSVFGKCKREGLPVYWITQLQHYMTFPGVKRGIFIVFNAERWEMLHFYHDPDAELQSEIITQTREFFEMIQRGELPDDTPPTIELPDAKPADVVRFTSRAFEVAAMELREAQEIRKEAEALEANAKANLILLMNGARIAENDLARIYYQEQQGRTSFDLKAFQKDNPGLDLSKYQKHGKPFKTFRSFFFRGE